MHLRPLNRFVFLAAVPFSSSHAVESTRVVLLQMPAAEVTAARNELNDAAKTLQPGTMDAVMKRRGVSVVAEFKEENPWRGETVELKKDLGEIKFGGEVAHELAAKVRVDDGISTETGIREMLTPEVDLPVAAKSYLQFQSLGNSTILKSGRWTERACWGDGKQTWMCWQYPVVERKPVNPPVPDDGRLDSFHVELHWLRASDADLAKATSSKPETRDKAFAWLSGRAKLWKECGFYIRKSERMAWTLFDLKLELTGDEVVAEQDGFSVDGEIIADGDSINVDWNLGLTAKSETIEKKLTAKIVPGVWHFLPVEGIAGANLVACRFTKN